MEDEAGSLPAKSDFSAWYNDILWRAEIMDVRKQSIYNLINESLAILKK